MAAGEVDNVSGPLLRLTVLAVLAMSALRLLRGRTTFWSPREGGGGGSWVVRTSPSAFVKIVSLRVLKYCLQTSPMEPATFEHRYAMTLRQRQVAAAVAWYADQSNASRQISIPDGR